MAEHSKAEIEMHRELMSFKDRAKRAAIEHKREIGQVKVAGIATVTAGALGYIEGRYPTRAQVANIRISGILAVAALGAGLGGFTGDEDTTNAVLAVGSGAAAAFAYNMGSKKGTAAAAPATTA